MKELICVIAFLVLFGIAGTMEYNDLKAQNDELKAKAEGSEFEFDNDAWQFGIDAWRNVGYGYWQRACRVTLT